MNLLKQKKEQIKKLQNEVVQMEKELNLRKEVSKMEKVAAMKTEPHTKEEEINVDTETMSAFSSALASVADQNPEELA